METKTPLSNKYMCTQRPSKKRSRPNYYGQFEAMCRVGWNNLNQSQLTFLQLSPSFPSYTHSARRNRFGDQSPASVWLFLSLSTPHFQVILSYGITQGRGVRKWSFTVYLRHNGRISIRLKCHLNIRSYCA